MASEPQRPRSGVDAVVARFYSATGSVVGAGCLLGQDVVATCAHVVAAAVGGDPYGGPPATAVRVDFPFSAHETLREANVYRWVPIQPDGSGDIALLRLRTPVNTAPPPLRRLDRLWDQPFSVVGFPAGSEAGAWAGGHFRSEQGSGLCQLQTGAGDMAISGGFSGAPVWDNDDRAVVGLTVAADSADGSRTAYLIPVSRIVQADPALLPCPYQGLATFDECHADVFHGRDGSVRRVLALLEEQQMVVVAGSSGAGKSSLVRAGVLARLRDRGVATAVVRANPKSAPCMQFNEALAAVTGSVPDGRSATSAFALGHVEQSCQHDCSSAIARVPPDFEGVIAVDQLEELVVADAAAATDLIRYFATLLEARPGLRLLATLRWESLDALVTPDLCDQMGAGTVFLPVMARDELRQAILGPAEYAPGLEFESRLVDTILDDAGVEPGQLPLVEALLRELWEHRASCTLTHAGYADLGGVAGALARHADEAIADLDTGETAQPLRQLVGRLVRIDRTNDAFVRRLVARATLPAAEKALLAPLVAARLVVASAGGPDGETVEIAHQALIDYWPRLEKWIKTDRDFISWQAEADQQCHRWELADKDKGALLHGLSLVTAQRWAESRGPQISTPIRTYIAASTARRKREQRRLQTVAAVLAVLVIVAGTLGYLATDRASRIGSELAAANASALGQAALDIATNEPASATQFALSAFRSDPKDVKARSALLDRYVAQSSVDRVFAHLTAKPVLAIQQSADGATQALSTADGTTLFAHVTRDADAPRWSPDEGSGERFVLSPDGRRGLSVSDTGDFALWDLKTHSKQAFLRAGIPGDPSRVQVRFSTDGRYLAIIPLVNPESAPDASVWDLTKAAPVRLWHAQLPYLKRDVRQLWVTTDGRSIGVQIEHADLATVSVDQRVYLWSNGPHGAVSVGSAAESALSADGSAIYTCVIGDSDPHITVQRLADRTLLRSIALPKDESCFDASLTADGDHLLILRAGLAQETSLPGFVISLRTGDAFDIVVPTTPKDLDESFTTDFPYTQPRVIASDGHDHSLSVLVARGTSIYLMTGRYNWLEPLSSHETDPMVSGNGAFVVTSSRTTGYHVHDARTGHELAALPPSGVARSSLGPGELGITAQVLTQVYFDDATRQMHYAERALPGLELIADYPLPDASFERPVVITTADAFYTLVGYYRVLSVFDRHTRKQIGPSTPVGPKSGKDYRTDYPPVFLQDPHDPDRFLITDTEGKLVLWSASAGAEIGRLPIDVLRTSGRNTVAFDRFHDHIVAIDANHVLQVFDATSLKPLREGISVSHMDAIAGVTPDGYVILNENLGSTSTTGLLFLSLERGVVSGSIRLPGYYGLRAEARGGQEFAIDRTSAVPLSLQMSGTTWFDALCRTDKRTMTAAEVLVVPPGASTDPCAV